MEEGGACLFMIDVAIANEAGPALFSPTTHDSWPTSFLKDWVEADAVTVETVQRPLIFFHRQRTERSRESAGPWRDVKGGLQYTPHKSKGLWAPARVLGDRQMSAYSIDS